MLIHGCKDIMHVANDQIPFGEESDRLELAEIASESLAVVDGCLRVFFLNEGINQVAGAGEMRFIIDFAPHQVLNDGARYGHVPRCGHQTLRLVVHVSGCKESLVSRVEHHREQRPGDLADANHLAKYLISQMIPILGHRDQLAISRLHKDLVAGFRQSRQQYDVVAGRFQAGGECPTFINEVRLQQQKVFVHAVTSTVQ